MSDTTQRESNSSDLTEKESECISSKAVIPQKVVRPAASQIEDILLAASKMREADRRSFQAEIALKYCGGSARMAETIFGWGRESVEAGLGEKRTGIVCLGARATKSGNKCWEEKQPQAAEALRKLAESHAQQDPTFHSLMAYTRLTAAEALRQLQAQGFEEELPAPSTMALILNRMGYRLRKVVKAKPQKKSRKPTPYSKISRKKSSYSKRKTSSE
jgi:hypothetical protein